MLYYPNFRMKRLFTSFSSATFVEKTEIKIWYIQWFYIHMLQITWKKAISSWYLEHAVVNVLQNFELPLQRKKNKFIKNISILFVNKYFRVTSILCYQMSVGRILIALPVFICVSHATSDLEHMKCSVSHDKCNFWMTILVD